MRAKFWDWAKFIHSEWFNAHGNLNAKYEHDADLAWQFWEAAATPEWLKGGK